MKAARFLKGLLLTLAIGLGLPANAAEIVYDNSADYSGFDYESTNEFGDEVILGGTARVVTEIQLEYYAQYTPQGDEIGRVRFYSNTGPAWMGNPDYPTPASPPLYEQTFQLTNGYQVAVISVPDVVVPNSFTWTVQFLGISQTSTNDRAGLLFYGAADGAPAIGQSFNDFWERLPSGWAPLFREDVPKNNFGARILAVASASPPRLTITKSNNNVIISWPTSSGNFTLESKAALNSTTWSPVGLAPTINGSNFQVVVPIGTGNRFFRLRSP
jgi:hypothetical protein